MSYAVPAPVDGVHRTSCTSYVTLVPVVEYIEPAASYVTLVPVVEYIARAASYFTPAVVDEYMARTSGLRQWGTLHLHLSMSTGRLPSKQ